MWSVAADCASNRLEVVEGGGAKHNLNLLSQKEMPAQSSSSTPETNDTEELFQTLGDTMQRFKKIKFNIDTVKKAKKKCSTISKELLQAEARHEKIVKDYEEAWERLQKSRHDLREMRGIRLYCGMSDIDLKMIAKKLDKGLQKTAEEVQSLLKTLSSLASLE